MHSSGKVPRQTASMSSHQVMAEKRVIIFLRDQMPCGIAMKEEACKAKIENGSNDSIQRYGVLRDEY
jgi:hypothetical protein